MKHYLFFLMAALVWSCSNANLFSPNDDENNQKQLTAESVIEMQISGGFAGVNQQLLVDPNGAVSYIDFAYGQREIKLAAEEINRLVALFIEKDFLHMQPEYVDPRVADAFQYQLTFKHGGATKRVATDYLSAPAELKALVDALRLVVDALIDKSLVLEFKTSHEILRPGEKMTLTLTATNRSNAPITIQFSSGQQHDFFASSQTTPLSKFPPAFVWNWAHDKAFILIFGVETFQPGESRTYAVEWDGRSNKGEALAGEFWLGARLVAQPGGYSAWRRVTIAK